MWFIPHRCVTRVSTGAQLLKLLVVVTFKSFTASIVIYAFIGTQAAGAITFSAQVKFSLEPDEDGSVKVERVACGFTINTLDVRVLSGNHKTLFGMIIGVFSSKLTSAVENELVGTIKESLPFLKEVLTKNMKAIRPENLLTKGGSNETKALASEFDMNTPMGRMMAAKAAKTSE